jgi:hypothetical protein
MIDLPIALLLAGGLLFVVFCFVDYATAQEIECPHTNWAQYQSLNRRVCIECGKIEPTKRHL